MIHQLGFTSIKQKLILIFTSISIFALIVGFGIFLLREYRISKSEFIKTAQIHSRQYAQKCGSIISNQTADDLDSYVQNQAVFPDLLSSIITDNSNQILLSYHKREINPKEL